MNTKPWSKGGRLKGGAGNRNQDIPSMLKDRAAGLTYKAIGQRYGVSEQQVWNLVKRETERCKSS